MPINLVILDGVVKSPALRYASDGKPEFRFTLLQQDGSWPLYWPCTAVGQAAERLASELDDGQAIVITSGKLCYRKRSTKLGEQSRMEILVWQIDRLTELPQDQRSEVTATPESSNAPMSTPEPKPRRKPYPKAALQGGFTQDPN